MGNILWAKYQSDRRMNEDNQTIPFNVFFGKPEAW